MSTFNFINEKDRLGTVRTRQIADLRHVAAAMYVELGSRAYSYCAMVAAGFDHTDAVELSATVLREAK